jgi:transposase
MLTPPVSMRIFLAAGATDLRKSFGGLSAAVESVLARQVLSGEVFLFCNRRRDRVKAIYWDGSGLWVASKRLEEGTFAWPADASGDAQRVELRAEELAALLGGLDLSETTTRRWYRRPRTT